MYRSTNGCNKDLVCLIEFMRWIVTGVRETRLLDLD